MAYIKEGFCIIGVPEPAPYPLYEKGKTIFDGAGHFKDCTCRKCDPSLYTD